MSESKADESEPVVACRLVRFNPHRIRRGCSGAAEVEIESEGHAVRLWMTLRDVERNIVEFGRLPGLVDALDAYRNRKAVTR